MTTDPSEVPKLVEGDCLGREEFHRRYCATPSKFRAQLIEGRVVLGRNCTWWHGRRSVLIACWLGQYILRTPGVEGGGLATILLGPESEPEPDALLIIEPEFGGRTSVSEDDCRQGPPELLVEIADKHTEELDFGPKPRDYERAGVQEYLIVTQEAIHWYRLTDSRYVENVPEHGIYRSTVFPGLWLHARALLDNCMNDLVKTVDRGTTESKARGVCRSASQPRFASKAP